MGVHYAVGVEQLLYVTIDLQDLWGLLHVEVGWLVEAHSVLCADAALVLGHLFEDETVLELCPLIEDDVHVQVSVSNVAVSQDEGLGLFPQVVDQPWPLSNIEGYVIGEDSSLFAHCCHGHILPYLPYFAILLVVVGNYGIVEVLHIFEEIVKLLRGGLHKKHVLIVLYLIKYAWMQVPDYCVIGGAIDILQCCQVLAQSSFDDGQALQNLLKFVSFKHHYFADVVYLFAEDIELGDHSQRAFSTYEQLLQIVSRVILVDFRTKVQNITIRHHSFQAENL